MTRRVDTRLVVTGSLRATAPLHVGGITDDLETDLPLARDGRGRLYVPGTSLAGPLRAWMESRFPGEQTLLRNLWGYQPNPKEQRATNATAAKDQGTASRILIEDGLVSPADLAVEVWDGVGIDRERGTAMQDIKFDRAVLPKGAEIGFTLRAELPTDPAAEARARALLGHLLRALAKGEIPLGAATTRGLGQVRLEAPTPRIENWASREGVLALLRGDGPAGIDIDQLIAAAPDLVPQAPERLRVTIRWHPDGPLMTKAGYDGVAVDILPMVSATGDGRLALVLPGSGIKGALRAQAERIVRTLLGRFDPVAGGAGRRRHLDQLDVPLVNHLFGTAKPAKADEERNRSGGQQPGKAALAVATVLASNGDATAADWDALIDADRDQADGYPNPANRPVAQALTQAGLARPAAPNQAAHLEQATHVAVDRWTGGAADSMLFSAIEPFNITWAPIELALDLARLPADRKRPALALLLLVLRDLAAGRITLGFGANRGYGTVVVERIEFQSTGGGDKAVSNWLHGQDWPAPCDLATLDADQVATLETAWQTWIDGDHDHA